MSLDNTVVSSLRAEFPALQQTVGGRPIVFFDGPGGTQVHGSVIEAMAHYLTEANSNTGAAYLYSHRTDETTAKACHALADFLNADRPDEIVFGPNMTTLTFNLSRAIGRTLAPGDEIVVTRLDHDGNIAPWLALQERGVVIRFADFDPPDCTLDFASLERAITTRTKWVAVGYASNAVGTINDVWTQRTSLCGMAISTPHRHFQVWQALEDESYVDTLRSGDHAPQLWPVAPVGKAVGEQSPRLGDRSPSLEGRRHRASLKQHDFGVIDWSLTMVVSQRTGKG